MRYDKYDKSVIGLFTFCRSRIPGRSATFDITRGLQVDKSRTGSAATWSRGIVSTLYCCPRRSVVASLMKVRRPFEVVFITRPGRCAPRSAFVDPHQGLSGCTSKLNP